METEIILIEDNKSDADLVYRALNKLNLNWTILHLKNGQDALDYFFGTATQPDSRFIHFPKVVFLDLKMPKVSGIEVLRRLKTEAVTKTIPIVVLSSSQQHSDIAVCYELGVNSYVVKPLNFEEFVNAVSKLALYWLTTNEPPKPTL